MYPHGTSHGSPSWGDPGRLSSCPADLSSDFAGPDAVATNCPIRVLSVGRIESGTRIRDAFIDSSHFTVWFVHDYRELWISSKEHSVDAVVMQNTLCSFELAEAVRLVRGRWPRAKILLIHSGELSLDRGLYDELLHPPVKQEVLVETILKLSKSSREEE